MSSFTEAIEASREVAPLRPDTSSLEDGPVVQLSVRVAAGLRRAVSASAGAQGETVAAFVERALRRAVVDANDSFAGLSSTLAANVRAQLHSAVHDGAYLQASSEVDREEAWS